MKHFLDKNITLRRLKELDANRSVYSATGTAVGYPSSIQEPSPEKAQFIEGQIGNTWFAYVEEGCPVLDGDQVVHKSHQYSVTDIKVMDFGGQHYKRITIVKNANAS